MVRSKLSLAAKNLFLRKQVVSYEERGVRPQRLSDPVRLCLVLLSYLFDWHPVFEGGETCDSDPLASKCISVVLEMEVAADGKARRAIGNQRVDSENGIGESDVGTSADCSGTAVEDRYPIITWNYIRNDDLNSVAWKYLVQI